jgi:hypothetical protein
MKRHVFFPIFLSGLRGVEERNELFGFFSVNPVGRVRELEGEWRRKLGPRAHSTLTLNLSGPKFLKAQTFVRTHDLTLSALLHYAWHRVLHLFGTASTTVSGTVVSGRSLPIHSLPSAVGLFINTLPLIFDQSRERGAGTVLEGLRALQSLVMELEAHASADLSELVGGGGRGGGGSPLFDSLFVYENYPDLLSSGGREGLRVELLQVIEEPDFPLLLQVLDLRDSLSIRLIHDKGSSSPHKIYSNGQGSGVL